MLLFPNAQAPTVVAIDDDATILLMISKTLTAEGMICHTASTGKAGLHLIRENKPDLVLLDIVMVGEDGFSICREIRRTWSAEDLPVVMVTGLDDMASIQAAYQAGANDFLTKPLHWKHLAYRINHVLQANRAFKAIQDNTQSLHDSEERYQRITEAITDYIYTVHMPGELEGKTTHGPGCLGITGYQASDFSDDPFLWFRMVVPEDRSKVEEQVRRFLAGEDPPPIEHRLRQKNGAVRWVQNTFVPHRDEHGVLVAYDGLVQDITERKQAEELLRSSEATLNLALDSAQMGVWTWDLKENTRHFDDRVCQLLGIDKDSFGGTQEEFFQMVSPEDHEGIQTAWRKTFDENLPYEVEYRVRWKNGSIHVICARGRLIRDQQGQPLQILGLLWDITEQKRNVTRLEETLQRLQLATTSASMGVWDWDLVSGSMTWDDRMFELYGATHGEIHGTVQDWKDGLHPEDLERAVTECEAALRGNAPFNTEFRLKHKDGTILWIKADGLVIRDAHGKPLRMIGLNQDITERREAEARLLESEEKFAKLYHLSPDAIDLTHLETGVQVEANQSSLKMFGYPREELIGHSTLPGDLGIWVSQENRDRHVASLKEHGEDLEFEALLRRKDGSIFIGLLSSSLLEINGEQYNLSVIRDISDRKQAEEEIRRLNEGLEHRVKQRTAQGDSTGSMWDPEGANLCRVGRALA